MMRGISLSTLCRWRPFRALARTAVWAFALSLGASTYAGGTGPLTPGDLVGRFELAHPNVQTFVLRGTLPVPAGVYPRSDGKNPFVIRNLDGERSSAQVEIVSRYAGLGSHADVVELIATVERPTNVEAGEYTTYDVVYWPHDPLEFSNHAAIDILFGQADRMSIRTRDVFGNEYRARPLRNIRDGWRTRTLRDGHAAIQESTHTTLMPRPPVPGPQGTLPHMMGVHTYVTRWTDEPFLTLDLRIHNAHSGLNPDHAGDDALGRIYFESIELVLPPQWVVLQAFDDPTFGSPYLETEPSGVVNAVWPFVKPMSTGDMHMMPRMGQFHRRFVIARRGWERRGRRYLHEENLGFCKPGMSQSGRELWSWWNPDTARYFPQNHVLPDLDHVPLLPMRDRFVGDLAAISAMIAGNAPPAWPIVAERMGWAYPWGTSHGGMVGGTEIFLYDGIQLAWSSSNAGYRLAQLTHQMYSDRQPNMLFDASGWPTMHEHWVVNHPKGPVLPIWWYNGPILYATDPFGFGESPDFQRNFVENHGFEPPYRTDLESYAAIDEEHLVRYTRSPKVLVWLGNDAVARDDIWTQAEGIRFTYTDLPQDHYGGIVPTGMLAARNYVNEFPNKGFSYGRAEGWGLDVMTAAYAILDPEWREKTQVWFEKVAALIRDGQSSCTGIIQSTPLWNVFNGSYRCRQSIEAAITENALWGMKETVFGAPNPVHRAMVNDAIVDSAYAMISPLVWSDALHGPYALFATGLFDNTTPPFCNYIPWNGNQGNIDSYQVWSTFAYAYELTEDPIFLEKAEELLQRDLNPGLLDDGLTYIENRAALIALLQSL